MQCWVGSNGCRPSIGGYPTLNLSIVEHDSGVSAAHIVAVAAFRGTNNMRLSGSLD